MPRVPKGEDATKLRPQTPLYIACEFLDLSFTLHEVRYVQNAWKEGIHLGNIAAGIKRDPDEVAILLMDLGRKNRIGKRKGGVLGVAGAEVV